MNDKYAKVVYESEPIGKEKIVLCLTTFDLETFDKDQTLEKIPTKKIAKVIEIEKKDINQINFLEMLEGKLEVYIRQTYGEQLLNMKSYIELNRKLPKAEWYKVGEDTK